MELSRAMDQEASQAVGVGCPGCEGTALGLSLIHSPAPTTQKNDCLSLDYYFLIHSVGIDACREAVPWCSLQKSLEFNQLQRLRWSPWHLEGTLACTNGSCFPLSCEFCNPSKPSFPYSPISYLTFLTLCHLALHLFFFFFVTHSRLFFLRSFSHPPPSFVG